MYTCSTQLRPSPVHPHTRGDITLTPGGTVVEGGSPPHAWGHCRKSANSSASRRFTPTRVGTLYWSKASTRHLPVHPHTRGDISAGRTCSPAREGSPPHAWGHLQPGPRGLYVYRFTPTRVGTLPPHDTRVAGLPVHPHTRGDIDESERRFPSTHGSPPHAWGHFRASWMFPPLYRFTPTRVGTFRRGSAAAPCIAVHPHTRGDI